MLLGCFICLLLFINCIYQYNATIHLNFCKNYGLIKVLLNEKNIHSLPTYGSATFLCTDRNGWDNDG